MKINYDTPLKYKDLYFIMSFTQEFKQSGKNHYYIKIKYYIKTKALKMQMTSQNKTYFFFFTNIKVYYIVK